MGVLKCFHQDPAGAPAAPAPAVAACMLHARRPAFCCAALCTLLPGMLAVASTWDGAYSVGCEPPRAMASWAVPAIHQAVLPAGQPAAGVRMRGLLERVDSLLSSDSDPQVRARQPTTHPGGKDAGVWTARCTL